MEKYFNMNITDELNKIIIDYELDKYFLRFRKKLQAEKIIKKIFSKAQEEYKEIAIIGVNKNDIYNIKKALGIYKKDIYINYYLYADLYNNDMCLKGDMAYVISFKSQGEVISWLEKNNICYINLYDEFLKENLYFDDEYYYLVTEQYEDSKLAIGFSRLEGRKEKYQLEYYTLKRKLSSNRDNKLKEMYLEQMLFWALQMKNFIEAENVVEQLVEEFHSKRIENAWREVKELLGKIKKTILERKEEDVIMYWMDALSYEESQTMMYVNNIRETAVSFSNIFTVTPNTSPTLKAIFCGKDTLNDKGYTIKRIGEDNSDFLSYLKEKKYEISIVSGYWSDLIETMEIQDKPDIYDSASAIYWRMLEIFMNSCNKQFILLHAVHETHFPFFSLKMNNILDNPEERFVWGKEELDEQIRYYNSFLGDNSIQIFMSDHGLPEFRTRFHVNLDIKARFLEPRIVKEMISIIDLGKIIKEIIDNKNIDVNHIKRDYVVVENLDLYNKNYIKDIFTDKKPLQMYMFGYRGIITPEEIYLRFSMEKEWLVNRNNLKAEPHLFIEREIENTNHLEEYRNIVRPYPAEEMEKSKKLQKLYEAYKSNLKKISKIINDIFSEFEDNSIAIRMGGEHSFALFNCLTDRNKKKVMGFIDKSENCCCASLGRKIITPTDALGMSISAVVLSSFDYLSLLRNESKKYLPEVQIIDLYQIFAQKGFAPNGNFYEKMVIDDTTYDLIYISR